MLTVRNYFSDDWPPQPGGPLPRGRKIPSDGTVVIGQAFPVRNGHLTFSCEYDGFPHTYDLPVTDRWREVELYQVLRQHVGKTVDELGSATLTEAAWL